MDDTAAIPTTAAEAYEAGRLVASEGRARLHDLTGQMQELEIPLAFRGNWLSGVEDSFEDDGMSVQDPDEDGYGWERRALAGADASS